MAFKRLVRKPKTDVDVDTLREMFPQRKTTITKDLAHYVDSANNDEDFNGDEFLDTLVSYRDVMLKGTYSIKEYVTAVKFCAYLIAEDDNLVEAYKRARGDDDFVKTRVGAASGSKEYNALTSAASRYRQSKLVKELLTVSQMPLYLMFQGERYKAVEVLADEMQSAAYSKDRINAADKLLTHVKPPENMQIELEVGPNQESKDLSTSLSEKLATTIALQKQMLEAGVPLEEAQKLGIQETVIEAEIE
jgi:hypothetical protein